MNEEEKIYRQEIECEVKEKCLSYRKKETGWQQDKET